MYVYATLMWELKMDVIVLCNIRRPFTIAHLVGNVHLENLSVINLFFDSSHGDEAEDDHVTRLPDSPAALARLLHVTRY